jgi:antitoxin HigA-1
MARLKPIHPGEILREEFMVPLHLNANKLALALHVPAPSIYDIVREERGISPEMALRLEDAFGTTPDFWQNLQSEFDLHSYGIKWKLRLRIRFVLLQSTHRFFKSEAPIRFGRWGLFCYWRS